MLSGGAGAGGIPEIRTFLIADIRGYTSFTQLNGDEAAAEIAARFAGVIERVVTEHSGTLVELRGDEALTVFASSRQALRAAVATQAALRPADADERFPLGVGIG